MTAMYDITPAQQRAFAVMDAEFGPSWMRHMREGSAFDDMLALAAELGIEAGDL